MPEKATLEIQIKDAGGSLGDYGGPIRNGAPQPATPPQALPSGHMQAPSNGTNTSGNTGTPGIPQVLPAGVPSQWADTNKIVGFQEALVSALNQFREELLQAANSKNLGHDLASIPKDQDAAAWRLLPGLLSNNPTVGIDAFRRLAGEKNTAGDEQARFLYNSFKYLGGEIHNFAADVASLDVRGFGDQLIDTTKKIPYAGEAIGIFTDTIRSAIDGLNSTAIRFTPYNPELAEVQAGIEIERTLRDIASAQQLGPQLAGFLSKQEDVRQRTEDLLLKLLPRLIPIAERGLDYAETIIALLEMSASGWEMILDKLNEFQINILGEDVGAGNAAAFGLVGSPVTMILELLTRIRQNGESRASSGFGDNLADLYRQLFPNDQLPDAGPVVGVQNGAPNIQAAQGQVPFRLPNPIP